MGVGHSKVSPCLRPSDGHEHQHAPTHSKNAQPLRLDGHVSGVMSLCTFEGDTDDLSSQPWLVSAGNAVMRVWNADTCQCLRVLHGHSSAVRSVCMLEGGLQMVSCGDDGIVCLWDLATGSRLRVFKGHLGIVWGVCALFSENDTTPVLSLALQSARGRSHTAPAHDVTWHEDGVARNAHGVPVAGGPRRRRLSVESERRRLGTTRFIVSCGDDKAVKIWNVETGENTQTMNGHSSYVLAVCALGGASGDPASFASAGDDRTVRIWSVDEAKPVKTLVGHTGTINAICALGDRASLGRDNKMASASDDGTVRIWNLNDSQCIKVLRGHWNQVFAVCSLVNPNGTRLVTGGADKSVRVWDADTGECTWVLDGHSSNIISLCALDGGTRIASGSLDRSVRVWKLREKGRPMGSPQADGPESWY